MVYSYYEAGRMIVEEEQGGKERAAYGKYILKELSQRLTQKFGRGYSYDNLKLMRKFYLVYSKDSIGETPFPQSENNKYIAIEYKGERNEQQGKWTCFISWQP